MNTQKRMAIIQDMAGYGRCSMSVAIPLVSACGIQACPMPTAVFSNHSAYSDFYCVDLTEHMEEYYRSWQKIGAKFDGVLVGYLASVKQVQVVKAFIEEFKDSSRMIVVDPVMGDNGKLYKRVDSQMKQAMTQLVRMADVITPNVTEAYALAGVPYNDKPTVKELENIASRLLELGPKYVIITSIESQKTIGNLIVSDSGNSSVVRQKKEAQSRCGAGDAFAALLASYLLKGMDVTDSVRNAGRFVAKAVRRANELQLDRREGIAFEDFLKII